MEAETVRMNAQKGSKFHSGVRIALLCGFALLAGLMYWLESHGTRLGAISATSSVAFFLFLVFAAATAYEAASLAIEAAIRIRRGAPGDISMLTSLSRVVLILAVVILVLYSTGTLKEIGTAIGAFAGLLLGWSLQAPVSGVAAWALISLKRPFRVGDRVLFPSLGLIGDVLDIGFMYTRLNQVGGAVGSEEAVNRDILIPNAMLFSQVAINYTPRQYAAYFLDEIVIRLTYDSDWNQAERILLAAAQEVTADIIRETGKQPYIRSDIYDYGVYLRLRYMTPATERPRIAHEINRKVFGEFQRNPRVDFAIPFVYSYRRGLESGGRSTMGSEQMTEIPLDCIDDPEADVPLSDEDRAGVTELAERIEKMGLLQPIVVRRKEGGRYELVAGRFRLLACKHLGWKAMQAVVKTGALATPGSAEE